MPASAEPLPLVCEVTSEEVPTISIRLEERTPTALRGVLIQDAANSGTALLFENDLVWNPHKRDPKPQDVNRVIFVGLDNALLFCRTEEFAPNRELLKAAAGFWTISAQCLGGRVVRG